MENKKNNKIKILVLAIIFLMVFFVNSCGNDKEEPISCQCPNEATHLEVGASNITCPANKCPHTGDCTQKVNEMLGNGTTKIVKSVGVDVEDFNVHVSNFSTLSTNDNLTIATSFKANIVEVRILPKGSGISYQAQTKVLSVGCDEVPTVIVPYLISEGIIQMAQFQPQTNSTWLAYKGNKGKIVYVASTWQNEKGIIG